MREEPNSDGKDRDGKTAVDAGDCTQKRDLAFVFSHKMSDNIINLADTLVNIREVPLDDTNSFLLFKGHVEAFYCLDNSIGLLLQAPL